MKRQREHDFEERGYARANVATGWGGARPNSGRKRKGPAAARYQRSLAAKLRYRLVRLQREDDAREYARKWLDLSEPEILRRVMESDDTKAILEVWKEMRRYAYGLPVSKLEIESGPSPLAILQQILQERRERESAKAQPSIETSAKELPS